MAAHSCKCSWMCLGHVFGGRVGFAGAKGIGPGSASRRGRLRWLGQPSGESPSVPGLLHLPNVLWISPPLLCVCCAVQREVGGIMSGHGLGVFVICPLEAYTTSFVCASGVGTISNHNIPMQSGHLGLLTEDFMSGGLYLKCLNFRVGNKSSLCTPCALTFSIYVHTYCWFCYEPL